MIISYIKKTKRTIAKQAYGQVRAAETIETASLYKCRVWLTNEYCTVLFWRTRLFRLIIQTLGRLCRESTRARHKDTSFHRGFTNEFRRFLWTLSR